MSEGCLLLQGLSARALEESQEDLQEAHQGQRRRPERLHKIRLLQYVQYQKGDCAHPPFIISIRPQGAAWLD